MVFISIAAGIFAALIIFSISYVLMVRHVGREDSIGIAGLFLCLVISVCSAWIIIMFSTIFIPMIHNAKITLDDCPYQTEISIEDIYFSTDSPSSVSFIALDGTYHSTSNVYIMPSLDEDYHIISAYKDDDWMPTGDLYLLAVQVPDYDGESKSEVLDALAKMRLAASNIDFVDTDGD